MTLRLLLALTAAIAIALPASAPANAADANQPHAFDFNFGTWHTHIRRLQRPLSGSDVWLTYDGTVTVRKVLGGRANLEEIEADGPTHIEIMNLRLYEPSSQQWSLNGASSADGKLGTPMFGRFEGGIGTFYDQESYDGRMVLVRQKFMDITPSSYRFEQAFSGDGGTSWEPNFVANLTRISDVAPSEGTRSVSNTSHDFDFNYGTWKTHIRSLRQPASGPATWADLDGTVSVRKIWNGRALMEEIKAGNASGGFEGVTLFLYDPHARQWSQTYVDSDGTFDPPVFGGFRDGVGELVGQGSFDGKTVFMRNVWSNITPSGHHFEVQFSADGRAWHPLFVANLTRQGPGL
jgi:hypothetical protein